LLKALEYERFYIAPAGERGKAGGYKLNIFQGAFIEENTL
jgi:hypothetical protein